MALVAVAMCVRVGGVIVGVGWVLGDGLDAAAAAAFITYELCYRYE